MNWRSSAAAVAVLVAAAACHPAAKPASPSPPGSLKPGASAAARSPAAAQLQRDIDAILRQPALARGYWGVLVRSLKTDETLYARNADRLMMPASNMKIVTLAVAAARLGWDYTYETTLSRAGPIADGVLDGDLVVVGSGDPSLVAADGIADRVFDTWADRLKAAGIRAVRGRVVGDDRAFADQGLGFGWSWDDLPDDYAAAVGALQFNEDGARITIAPGPEVGDSASVAIAPAGTGLTVDNRLHTGAADTAVSIEARRLPGSARLELRGSIPLGAAPVSRTVSVDNPTQFFVNALRDALIARGIDVRGGAADIDDLTDPPARERRVALVTYRSAPLSTLAVRLMKVSQNQYAETLLKTTGAAAGTPTAVGGRAVVASVLQDWGIPPPSVIQRDGSGLSRYDYVTPETLVAILAHIEHDETLRGPFEAALPVAGRDGTLANRLKGTAAEGAVRAKTGSMANVRALSGYVAATGSEPLVFSIVANNFDAPPSTIIEAIDAIVVKLATVPERPRR